MSVSSVRQSSVHPFEHSQSMLVRLPNTIDVAEEDQMYRQMCSEPIASASHARSKSPECAPSVFSNDIFLSDNSGESLAFARDVKISGWTNVGDKTGSAYVAYDCAILTKEGTTIHKHKRYNAFAKLYDDLRRTLPYHQQHFVRSLPPKSPLAKYRPAFLSTRRKLLEHWLSSVLLHPDIGGSLVVRRWVME